MGEIRKLTVVVPAYNEEGTIYGLLGRVHRVQLVRGIGKEVVVVNDGSRDATEAEVLRFTADHPECQVVYCRHERNLGKGAAIHTAIEAATGDCLIVQDADLEYDPQELNILLEPLADGRADVVYGSRFVGGRAHRILFFWHSIGNKFLTLLSNACNNLNLTDMETGYKLFRTEILRRLALKERRFGFEPEVTAKVSRVPGVRIYEVGISYHGRTYQQGKKITWRDGFQAIYCILRYSLFERPFRED
ncbi:MAG: glycosyltransferase family 2 protein [Armatimonadetes bacterium]|nr:glycosyltransferase family 2 protein [Armatimonadota bacterium]